MRLRKRRAFTATVNTDTRDLDEPVIESELAAMAACGHPITVQKVLTPIFPGFERVARWMYARRERSAGGRGPRRPLGAASPLAQAELRAALEAQQQPLFWFELRVVSASHAACRMVAGAIAGRRRENVLRQRNTTFTPRAAPPPRRPRATRGDPLVAQRRHLGRRGGDALAAALAADRPHPPRPAHDPARARAARRRPRPGRAAVERQPAEPPQPRDDEARVAAPAARRPATVPTAGEAAA